MTNANTQTVGSSGTFTVRQRPSLLLMKLPARAAEGTLELGLAKLKAQCTASARLLTRLGASRVEVGEPHFADQGDQNPMSKMRAAAFAMRARPGAGSAKRQDAGVRAVLTAVWEVGAMSAEELLALVDRLRFEVAEDTGAAEAPEEPLPWAAPEEHMRAVLAQMQPQPADDSAPVFLFVARLDANQLEQATAEAFARARESAARLARAAGARLGKLATMHGGPSAMDASRPDKLMDRHRCAALLAGFGYEPGETECVSDDPRNTEFTVSVNVSYYLE